MPKRQIWIVITIFSMLLTACTSSATNSNAVDSSAVGELPAWQSIPLTDVRTGETFTLGGFEDKVVIVEAMAVWCPLCEQQQLQINSALAELGDDVVAVSLDVDPGETADRLQKHADRLGFPWRFALAGDELATMLQEEFGPQILAPTSTPVLIIGPDGQTTLTPFGLKGWDELVQVVRAK